MSNAALTWVGAFPRGTFTPPQRFVLMILADLADRQGLAFPGLGYLMDQTEMGESTLRRALAELEEAGYLKREATYRANGSQSSNRYVLVGFVPPVQAPSRAGPPTSPGTRAEGGGARSGPPKRNPQ